MKTLNNVLFQWYPSHYGFHLEETSFRMSFGSLEIHSTTVPCFRSHVADVYLVRALPHFYVGTLLYFFPKGVEV